MADDDVDGSHCTRHPYRATSSPGGICALCLQDKLGQLVSSSSSSFIATSSPSPSPSPSSFRSLSTTASTSSSLTLTLRPTTDHHRHADVSHRRGPHLPFLRPKKSAPPSLSRSKSTATPRSTRYGGFWSFLYSSSGYKKQDRPKVGPGPTPTTTADSKPPPSQTVTVKNVGDDNSGGGDKTGLCGERKVARSRSVGCGSRSFSGDFFERISTGLGDCALRRVESNREGRRSSTSSSARDIVVKDRVRCGGLFGGFVITSSSSSSSSSSYLTAVGDDPNGRPNGPGGSGPLGHGRSRSWGRALASPMRAFTKPVVTSTTTIKHSSGSGSNNNGNNNKVNGTTMKSPNLADIPSLLSVR